MSCCVALRVMSAEADLELEKLLAEVAEMEEGQKVAEMQQTASAEEGVRKGPAAAQAVKQASIYVGNLDPRANEVDLKAIFSGCGPITRVTIMKDKATQQPKGFAYVEFEKESSVNQAMIKDGQQLHGKPIKVSVKRENVPMFMRAQATAPGAMPGLGRGAPNMSKMMMGMMSAFAGNTFAPYRGGRGRGRGGM